MIEGLRSTAIYADSLAPRDSYKMIKSICLFRGRISCRSIGVDAAAAHASGDSRVQDLKS